jgi:hypothetical protein
MVFDQMTFLSSNDDLFFIRSNGIRSFGFDLFVFDLLAFDLVAWSLKNDLINAFSVLGSQLFSGF